MSDSELPTLQFASLGSKIRQFRQAQKLTLSSLAQSCALSTSFLSQIERDQANPSVATLHTIAQALGLTMTAFFDGPGSSAEVPQEALVRVVHRDERKVLIYPGSGNRNELLSPDLNRQIQMMRTVIPPGADTGNIPLVHEGEECGLVLQGQVEIWVGEERFELGPGDSFYHPSTVPHRSRNIGDEDVVVIVAITPPSF